MNPVEISHLTKRYPGFCLDDVSLTVPAGYVTGFVGANGSGKTTTIGCALGLVQPDSGSARTWPHERVGVVFDTPPYHAEWRVRDVGEALGRFYPAWRDDIYHAQLGRSDIDPGKKVRDLSRGMGMRLQMAVALAHQPDLLVLDEPTSGLDPLGRQQLVDDLADFVTDENHAVWFSTHITTDLDRLADYLVIIDAGRIFACGTTDEVLGGFRLVRGTPDTLPGRLRNQIYGLRETRTGWEGLLRAEQVPEPATGVLAESPTIEDIAVHIAKESHHE